MALAISASPGRADHHPAPAHALIGTILEASAAELGWLAWLDRPDPLVLRAGESSPIDSMDIAEFPDPLPQPLVVDAAIARGPREPWGQLRGTRPWARVPGAARGRAVVTL